jgi:hypothetical protein
MWVDAHKDDNIWVTISDLPPVTNDSGRWLSDGYKIAFDCGLSRDEIINLFGLSQSDVDGLLNDEVYMVSFDNLGSITLIPDTANNTIINSLSIKEKPSNKIYYDSELIEEFIKGGFNNDEHKNSIDDEYNLKSYI